MEATFVKDKYSTRDGVLEIIREMPGVTGNEIVALMPHVTPAAVRSMITYLKARGDVVVSGKKEESWGTDGTRHNPTYALSEDGKPPVKPLKHKEPSSAALHATIKSLQDTISDLEEWKRNAIVRFPDLAVDPVVLRARKLVAAEVRAGGDNALAEQIMLGTKDATLMVRVTVKALEEAGV